MVRIKRGTGGKNKHKNIIKAAKGFVGSSSKLFRIANQQVMKALSYSFSDRRKKKGQIKNIWIIRINSLTKDFLKLKYSRYINLLKKNIITINRKMCSESGQFDKSLIFNSKRD